MGPHATLAIVLALLGLASFIQAGLYGAVSETASVVSIALNVIGMLAFITAGYVAAKSDD